MQPFDLKVLPFTSKCSLRSHLLEIFFLKIYMVKKREG